MRKNDLPIARLSELLEQGVSYFGMALWESPRSANFRQHCLRTPDVICSVEGEGRGGWLVLWKSWENGVNGRGVVEREGDHRWVDAVPGCSQALPLSVVLYCLAGAHHCAYRLLGVIAAAPLPSAGCADVRWDVPQADLYHLRRNLHVHGVPFRLYTPDQLDAFYSGCTLKRQKLLRIPESALVQQGGAFFSRALRIASLISCEEDYRALREAYEEAFFYGAMLHAQVKSRDAARELDALRQRMIRTFAGVILQPWYAGSALQREQHPAGVARLCAPSHRALFDFTPNRRWALRAEGDWFRLQPAAEGAADALPFDPATGCHALPKEALFLRLGDESVRDVYFFG